MSVNPSDLLYVGSANMPEADGLTTGGAFDATKGIVLTNIGPSDSLDVVSTSASDTAVKISFAGRDSTGVVHTIVGATVNGQTPVVGLGSTVVLERLLYAVITGGAVGPLTDPGGTPSVSGARIALYGHTPVISAHTARAGSANASGITPPLFALQTGDGAAVAVGQIIRIVSGTGVNELFRILATSGYGTDVVAVLPFGAAVPDVTSVYSVYNGMLFRGSQLAITTLFATSSSDVIGGSTRTFYEKVFVTNTNTATALTGSQVEVLSESPSLPAGQTIDIALTTALNDAGSVANRQTAPSTGIGSFVVQPALVNVPAPGNLPPGAAPNAAGSQGMWLRLTLAAGSGAYEGSVTLRTMGNTV